MTTDQEEADNIRAAVIQSAALYLEHINAARLLGFQVRVAMGPNPSGEIVIQQMIIAKHF